MIGQLQSLFSGLKKSDLLHEGGRVKDNPSAIEDIFDGKIYKNIFVDNFFKGTKKGRKEKEIHISLQRNTDGVTLFRSSTYKVWPLYLTVNELNPKLSSFLFHLGTDVVLEGRSLLLRAVLHSVVCDAPARCLVQNFVQFNGYFGCGSCLSKGKSVKTGERGSMMSYPFDISEAGNFTGVSTPRTHTQGLTDARRAGQHRSCQNGVKGFSPLYKLPFFDMIRCVTVDYMHCVLLGVQKKCLHLWTGSANKNEKFYIGNFTSIFNERLQRLSPPNLITRLLRCIEDLKNWKASEFRSFLLFYSHGSGYVDGSSHLHESVICVDLVTWVDLSSVEIRSFVLICHLGGSVVSVDLVIWVLSSEWIWTTLGGFVICEDLSSGCIRMKPVKQAFSIALQEIYPSKQLSLLYTQST
ncbi:uncharacterized protein [Haliotis asinina]|uniref:uncharacterized protein n=1 Tax=Haliotis asinina TaxID=109174 RepID=UPI0035324350